MNERQAYEQKLQAKLNEWGAEIDKLKAKADKAGADARLDYQKQVEKLRSMKEDGEEKLAELRDAGDDTWKGVKAKAEDARNSLENALKSVRSRLQ